MSIREFLDLVHESWKTHFERGWYRYIGWCLGLNEKANLCQRALFISLCSLTEDTWDQLFHARIVMTFSCDGLSWQTMGKLWQTKHSSVMLVTVGSGKAFSVLSKR